ncbi:hypothetical protein JD844_004757 [Phrynosoma platyrhinos]|uniref:Sarcosine dehydrogenase n=1 Tax=Phrynosoma platyrhinos TaxID=52577 RepID=A0ABQ7SDS3_PHRPL|nr:hypothetical protein JD844_004757 [Phrynosoma platyrhinos]
MRKDPLYEIEVTVKKEALKCLLLLPYYFLLQALDYDYYGAYGQKPHEDYLYNKLLSDEYTFDFPPHHKIIRNECLTCRNALAVFDMSYFGKFYLVGPEAQKAADWLFTADVRKPPGTTIYTCMLNKRGGVESDLTISPINPGIQDSALAPAFEGNGYYLAVGGAVAQHNWSHIMTVLQDKRFRCQLIDQSEELGMISIQGPARYEEDKVRAMRMSFVGEMGWELHIPKEHCVRVYRAVMKAGAKHGIMNAGYRAIDSLSIEKGFWKEAFMSVCKGKVPMFGLEAIWRNNKVVGHIRRADFGHAINKTIAYGYIRDPDGGPATLDFVKSGKYMLERMGVPYQAKAHTKSPFDPENKRVKGIY